MSTADPSLAVTVPTLLLDAVTARTRVLFYTDRTSNGLTTVSFESVADRETFQAAVGEALYDKNMSDLAQAVVAFEAATKAAEEAERHLHELAFPMFKAIVEAKDADRVVDFLRAHPPGRSYRKLAELAHAAGLL